MSTLRYLFQSWFEFWPTQAVLFLFLLLVLIVLVVKPPKRLCFWKRGRKSSPENKPRFKKVARVAAPGLLVFGLIAMVAAFWLPSVSVSVFYVGYASLWISIPFWIGARAGLLGFSISLPCLYLFWGLTQGLISMVPEIEKDYPKGARIVAQEDDGLDDKNPPYVPAFTEKRMSRSGYLCYFNKSAAVVGLDLADAKASEKKIARRIYPTFRAAKKAAEAFDCEFLPSLDLIDAFTKYFDDRLLAAVEEHVHEGSTIFPGGKQGFLATLLEEVTRLEEMPGRYEAAAHLAAAIELGGGQPDVAEAIRDKAKLYISAFLNDPRNSKPIGFYTRSQSLRKIFYRDRLLQKPFGRKFWADPYVTIGSYGREGLFPVVRMAEALLRRPDLREAYRKFRILAEKTCNPEANLNLEDLFPYEELFADEVELYQALLKSDAWERARTRGNINPNTLGVAFWPFSTSKESRLFARLYLTYELPETEIMNDLIVAIKDGRVSLEPETDSGWYDYQAYSLETLLLPEKAHEAMKLLLHARYKKRLRQAFEAMLTKRRETHVKQLFRPMTVGTVLEPVPETPQLSIEPSATHYLRVARAYRFLAEIIRDSLGGAQVANISIEDFDGGLSQELDDIASLFYGFYLVVCNDIGMVPKLRRKEIESLPGVRAPHAHGKSLMDRCSVARAPDLSDGERWARFLLWQRAGSWLRSLDNQKFLDEDVRLIVPVLSNYRGTKVRNWAVLGTRLLKIRAYYARPPTVGMIQSSSKGDRTSEDPEQILEEGLAPSGSEWQPKEYVIPVQVFAEVTLGSEPLTREEFRRICDRGKTKDEIVSMLVARSRFRPWFPGLVRIAAAVVIAVVLAILFLALWRRRAV